MDEATDDSVNNSEALFESLCGQKLASVLPDGDDNDIWADKTKEITFGGSEQQQANEDKKMDVDEDDREALRKIMNDLFYMNLISAWNSNEPISTAPIAMDTGNPWQSSNDAMSPGKTEDKATLPANATDEPPTSSTPPEGGWANFGDFESGKSASEERSNDNPKSPEVTKSETAGTSGQENVQVHQENTFFIAFFVFQIRNLRTLND